MTYETKFDSAGLWSFNNDPARNIIFFVLILIHHLMLTIAKNDFLMLGEGPLKPKILLLMKALVQQRKRLILIFVKQTQNFARVCF